MWRNIYQEIKKWTKLWILSDTHFNHQFMIDGKIRTKNYQTLILERWKSTISNEDIVFHLWDVIFKNDGELWNILRDLPGYKILILGNHDKHSPEWYIKKWFNEVYYNYIIPGDNPILLSHKPTNRMWCEFMICGHLHNYILKSHRLWDASQYIDKHTRVYSAEVEKYYPVLLEDIISTSHISYQYFYRYWYTKLALLWFIYLVTHTIKSFFFSSK